VRLNEEKNLTKNTTERGSVKTPKETTSKTWEKKEKIENKTKKQQEDKI